MEKHRSIGPFLYQNGRQSLKMILQNGNFEFDELNLPKNYNKPECYAHCWKAYLIGHNSKNCSKMQP